MDNFEERLVIINYHIKKYDLITLTTSMSLSARCNRKHGNRVSACSLIASDLCLTTISPKSLIDASRRDGISVFINAFIL